MSICLDTVPALETQMDGWMEGDGYYWYNIMLRKHCRLACDNKGQISTVSFGHNSTTALHLEMRIRQIMTLFGIRSMEYVLQQLTDITEVAAQVCDRHI